MPSVLTHHGTALGIKNKVLYHALTEDIPSSEKVIASIQNWATGEVIFRPWIEQLAMQKVDQNTFHSDDSIIFSLQSDGVYACAEPDGRVSINRKELGPWETFRINAIDLHSAERARLLAISTTLLGKEQPLCLHLGPGEVPKPSFLNIDAHPHPGGIMFSSTYPDNYFIFPFANQAWPLADNSVDYIYHEDFLEHIPQIDQWRVLAEALRVLKPGSIHRISTPCIKAAMLRHSNFGIGFQGVYTGELKLGHIAMLTRASLEEMAEVIGYSSIIFTKKNEGTSPFAISDNRPGPDRDSINGNIFVDLVK